MSLRVAIHRCDRAAYPSQPPYHPDAAYPEFPAGECDASNHVYAGVREALRSLGLDAGRAGTAEWNPLGDVVRPGDTVFLKPNMIAHKHARADEWEQVITHGSVVRAVTDYVHLALRGRGRIVIGDAPQTDSQFDRIVERMGLAALRDWYRQARGFEIEILDLRQERWIEQDGIYTEILPLVGDPLGNVVVNLNGRSMLAALDAGHPSYYGAFYDIAETRRHHSGGRHEYAICRTPVQADVFISLPKLKTHKKCGLTVNLKGLIGIGANKNWLPHYRFGAPGSGGDQYPHETLKAWIENRVVLPAKRLLGRQNRLMQSLARRAKRPAYRVFGDTDTTIRSGNWHGNDTIWRVCLDLNRILLYANPDGTLRPAGQAKRYFSIVDGVLAMEGNGPVAGRKRETGVILAGANPVAVDTICAGLMGFDWSRVPLVAHAYQPHSHPLIEEPAASIQPVSNVAAWNRPLETWTADDTFRFEPHFAWKEILRS